MQSPEGPRGTGPLPAALAERTGLVLAKVADEARAAFERAIGPMGLKRRYYGVLAVLAAEGPSSQQALGKRLRLDRTTMVDVADELERRGLAERRPNPRDRRAHHLTITDAGRDVLVRLDAIATEVEDATFAPLNAAERRHLHDLLTRLLTREGDG
ncbi:MAG: MarR family transcriptional regulator [Chloroflexota bacterium]|nr:MarR family transcriptional regulator [Chloroflexota bacterium]